MPPASCRCPLFSSSKALDVMASLLTPPPTNIGVEMSPIHRGRNSAPFGTSGSISRGHTRQVNKFNTSFMYYFCFVQTRPLAALGSLRTVLPSGKQHTAPQLTKSHFATSQRVPGTPAGRCWLGVHRIFGVPDAHKTRRRQPA